MNHLQNAILKIGVKEDPIGSNWGKDVTKDVPMFLHSVGISFPASWCMAFVYWCCFSENSATPLIKTGGVMFQWTHIDPKHKHTTPMAGDIFIMDHGHGLGHTGFVESVVGDLIHTIEGNTNDTGSREGYEVCRRVRKTNTCIGFIRI